MQSFQDFFQHNLTWLFLINIAWVLAVFGYLHYRHKQTGLVFPGVPPAGVRFDERTASGRSHKTLFTKLGGANRCLHVTVTDTEVWIRPLGPFNVFAQRLDLEHRIPRASITSALPQESTFGRNILLDYRDTQGQTHRLSLMLKKPDDFLKALSLQT
jgi:hypothetical protein